MGPIIGITGNFELNEECYMLKRYYVESINRAGGVAIILPPVQEEDIIDNYFSLCQGFLLSGGGDIDPIYWGETPIVGLGEISPLRDSFELNLARKAITSKIPILGICRGCQVLNVAAGGTVIQNIVSEMSHDQNAPRSYPFHAIFIEKQSLLASIIESISLQVNSFHHQAVGMPGPNLRISACAPDGTIEAVEAASHPFCIGVQWHPECLLDAASRRLFNALVNASNTNK